MRGWFVLKKRNRMIAKVKSKYWVKTYKFGIRVPKSVAEAKRLDEANSDTLWWDAICKEMKNVSKNSKETSVRFRRDTRRFVAT